MELEPLPQALFNHSVVSNNGYIYSIGGEFHPYWGYSVRDVYVSKITLDGKIEEWLPTTPLPVSLSHHSSVVHRDYLYVIGGRATGGGSDKQEIYESHINSDGSLSEWTTIGSLPKPLSDLSALVYRDNLLILGGFSDRQTSPESYSAKIDVNGNLGSWSPLQPLLYPAGDMAAVIYQSYIFALGGASGGSYRVETSMSKFNPESTFNPESKLEPWFLTTALPQPLSYPFGFLYKNYLYVGGSRSIYVAPLLLSAEPTPFPTLTPTPTTTIPGKKVCLQVITPARNPLTGECKNYPDSCIPDSWVKVSSCTI